MALSSNLVSKFVKATKDTTKTTKKETTVYGRITKVDFNDDGSYVYYVLLDGSPTPIPIKKFTAFVDANERVTVLIKDHSAIITGNISSAGASQINRYTLSIPVDTIKALWDSDKPVEQGKG